MFATGVTMGLEEWIIDNTCLVYFMFGQKSRVFICLFIFLKLFIYQGVTIAHLISSF